LINLARINQNALFDVLKFFPNFHSKEYLIMCVELSNGTENIAKLSLTKTTPLNRKYSVAALL